MAPKVFFILNDVSSRIIKVLKDQSHMFFFFLRGSVQAYFFVIQLLRSVD